MKKVSYKDFLGKKVKVVMDRPKSVNLKMLMIK